MKRSIFIITLMVMFSGGAFAQSEVVRTLPNLQGNNSIARSWNTKQLLYTEESNNNEMFLLLDNNSQNYSMQKVILKQWYKITDYIVHGDSVFFIGVYRNSRGFWGYFNIPNVFYSGDTITYFLTNTFSTAFGTPYDDWGFSFVRFDELQTFTGSSGATELLLTGSRLDETYVGGVLTHFSYTPCLFHVKPPYTNFNYAYNNSVSEKFDDIALVGNNIVVVGRQNYTASDSANILFRIFDGTYFSFTSGNAVKLTQQNFFPSMSKVLIEPIGNTSGNVFATVHHGNFAPYQGLFVEYYSIDLTNPYSLIKRNHYTFAGQGNTLLSGTTLKKATFNASANKLCVLQDMEMPLSSNSIKSTICKFDLSGFPFVPCSTSHRIDYGMSISSVANNITSSILYSGKSTPYGAMLMKEDISSQGTCMEHPGLSTTTANVPVDLPSTETSLYETAYHATRVLHYSAPVTSSCNVICRQ